MADLPPDPTSFPTCRTRESLAIDIHSLEIFRQNEGLTTHHAQHWLIQASINELRAQDWEIRMYEADFENDPTLQRITEQGVKVWRENVKVALKVRNGILEHERLMQQVHAALAQIHM
jgi:hypothetical protein